ncbi:hypothetical protein [Paraburkholderia sp. D1E]|uniref:hypothetical protein n=1 Tax=Paraburkholderia sp. D1E TaxID=3461398 RepID=UPI0040465C22
MNVRIAVILSITIQTPVSEIRVGLFAFGGGVVFCLSVVVFLFFCIAHAWVCLPAVLAFFGARLLVRRFLVWLPMVLAFPCFVSGLLASPLCGAGTYFSLPAAKKSRQKKAAHTASS